MKEICIHLGFVTENAQMYAKKGSDDHKLWDMLEITFIAFTDELLVEFVRHCLQNKSEPSVDNYWRFFSTNVRNPNYVYVQQIVLTFFHALMILRKGARRNNQQYIYAGKDKLSLLFFGQNHPHYHQLIAQEKRVEALMPQEVLNLKLSSLVLSRTGRVSHYQAGHAVIEEINKEGKRDLVGVLNETQWKRAFRNQDVMNEIRSSTFKDAGIKGTKGSTSESEHDIGKEVQLIRTVIRGHNYLENPWESCEHVNITKHIPLSKDLVNFTTIAKHNLADCLPKILQGEPHRINVVYSTLAEQEEAEKLENCTVGKLKKKVFYLFERFSNKHVWHEFYKKEVAGKTKSVYIDFLNSLLEIIEDEKRLDVNPESDI